MRVRYGMRRVLVVDDSKSVRTAIHAALDAFGVEIEEAESGPSGLQKTLASPWDLIFLDIEMPTMDGPTLLRIARARGVMTPVVLVTAVSATPVLSAAIRLGATHYILKPFTTAQIRAVASRLLKLELSQHEAPLPRVLVLAPDATVADDLAVRLPASVQVTTASALNQLLDLIGKVPPAVVVIREEPGRDAGGEAAAAAVRVFAPAAGIFLMRDDASVESVWSPEGAVDGVLPRAIDETMAHGVLYANFLRPLVFVDGAKVRIAAFQGDPRYHGAYFTSLTRQLIARCARLGAIEGLCIDLNAAPSDDATPSANSGRSANALLVSLIVAVSDALTARAASPWFVLAPALESLKSDPALSRALFL